MVIAQSNNLVRSATLLLVMLAGCGAQVDRTGDPSPLDFDLSNYPVASFPELPKAISLYHASLYSCDLGIDSRSVGRNDQVSIYTPDPFPSTPMPCIFMAPSGATSFTGKLHDHGDHREFLPYVHAGYIVVTYDLDGDVNLQRASALQLRKAFLKYEKSNAGLINARNAMNFALKSFPSVDPNRLYAVGHSSSGRQALLWAGFEPRIAACAVIAPEVVMSESEERELVSAVKLMPQRFTESLQQFMPTTHQKQIRCPVLIVHGEADQTIPAASSQKFVDALNEQGNSATYVPLANQDHFTVVENANPIAIDWLNSHPTEAAESAVDPAN